MCFSASASFTASAALGAIGFYTTFQAHKKGRLLSYIPFIFATQQLSEGFVWLAAQGTVASAIGNWAQYYFLLIALVIWPIYIPVALRYAESNAKKQKLITICIALGSIVAAWFFYFLLTDGATFSTQTHQIYYDINQTKLSEYITGLLYAIATITPFFISSIHGMAYLGIALSTAYVFTYFIYYCCFLSVWCFFAALLSVFLIYIFRWNEKL